MNEDKFLTIIDYGSSKIRLCVYDKSLPNQKYILDKTCNNDFSSIKTNLNDSEKILQEYSVTSNGGQFFVLALHGT